ncbi:MAG: cytochrome P450, partial [Synechococcales bacterium]|nr:cytochrome P450 [Synechococcales bacterium]
WSPWGKFVEQRSHVDQILYREIRDRRDHLDPDQPDILTLLLLARDAEGNPMGDVELRDELMTLLLAGHETTASALAWALYWIHEHPQVRESLLAELDGVSLEEPMAIARLPYLSAVCQETLRIYPIAPIAVPRMVVNQPFDLQGHAIPPETMIAPCIYLTHRREDLYANAHEFRPERFLERQFSPYEFLPFGGGNRQCVGMAFALFEMKLVLATLLAQYSLTRVGDRPLFPTRRGVTLAPPTALRMVATPRDHSSHS